MFGFCRLIVKGSISSYLIAKIQIYLCRKSWKLWNDIENELLIFILIIEIVVIIQVLFQFKMISHRLF